LEKWDQSFDSDPDPDPGIFSGSLDEDEVLGGLGLGPKKNQLEFCGENWRSRS